MTGRVALQGQGALPSRPTPRAVPRHSPPTPNQRKGSKADALGGGPWDSVPLALPTRKSPRDVHPS